MRHTLVPIFLTLILSAAHGDPVTTAPTELLAGRWRVMSMGRKPIPENIRLYWTFADGKVTVTSGNGDVATVSQYKLWVDGPHNLIALTYDRATDAERVGWYEFKNGKLCMQVTVGTGKPPESWNGNEIMWFERSDNK